jgi:hypothetical protein
MSIQVHPFLSVYNPPPQNPHYQTQNQNQEDYTIPDLDPTKIHPNDQEVSSVFSVPLKTLVDPASYSLTQFRSLPGVSIPTWNGPRGETIWGCVLNCFFILCLMAWGF